MKFFLIIFLLAFLSCAEDKNLDKSVDHEKLQVEKSSSDFVWICHHPGTDYHNQVCIEKIYPEGCYVPGDRTKFCWILNREDCSGKLLEDWQVVNCPHLKGD